MDITCSFKLSTYNDEKKLLHYDCNKSKTLLLKIITH